MNHSTKDKTIRMLPTPSILNRTNPEIFSTKPRAGGLYVEFSGENRNRSDTSKAEGYDVPLDLYNSTSRDYRLTSALEGSNWSLEGSEETDESIFTPDPLKDCMDMMAVTISTIMFMAADAVQDLSRDQLNWTVLYLKCIMDEFGNVPPNCRGILNHMKHIFNNDLTQFEDKPMYVDESGKIMDESEYLNRSKTEKYVVKITHKPEDEEPEAPPPEEA